MNLIFEQLKAYRIFVCNFSIVTSAQRFPTNSFYVLYCNFKFKNRFFFFICNSAFETVSFYSVFIQIITIVLHEKVLVYLIKISLMVMNKMAHYKWIMWDFLLLSVRAFVNQKSSLKVEVRRLHGENHTHFEGCQQIVIKYIKVFITNYIEPLTSLAEGPVLLSVRKFDLNRWVRGMGRINMINM